MFAVLMARSAGAWAAGTPVPVRELALDTPCIVGAGSDMSPGFSRRAVNPTGLAGQAQAPRRW